MAQVTKKIIIERGIDWEGFIITLVKEDDSRKYITIYGKNNLLRKLKEVIYF